MKTKEFNKVKPYTYVLIKKSNNKKYYGVRRRNVLLNTTPINDFGKKYSSSGEFRKEFIKYPNRFKFVLRWTFGSIEKAKEYEEKITKIITRKNQWKNWVNKGVFPTLVLNEISLKKLRVSLKKSWQKPERISKSIKAMKNSWTKERRLKNSNIQKRIKNTPEMKEKYSKNTKKLWRNNEYRKKVSKATAKVWKSKKRRVRHSKLVKKRYKNIIYLKEFSRAQKRKWENNNLRIKAGIIQKKVWSNPILKMKQSKIQKKIWNKNKNAEHSILMKKKFNKPEYKRKMKIINLLTWSNASKLTRKKHRLACKKAWEKRKLNKERRANV